MPTGADSEQSSTPLRTALTTLAANQRRCDHTNQPHLRRAKVLASKFAGSPAEPVCNPAWPIASRFIRSSLSAPPAPSAPPPPCARGRASPLFGHAHRSVSTGISGSVGKQRPPCTRDCRASTCRAGHSCTGGPPIRC